mgnify:CR=1 FL=1
MELSGASRLGRHVLAGLGGDELVEHLLHLFAQRGELGAREHLLHQPEDLVLLLLDVRRALLLDPTVNPIWERLGSISNDVDRDYRAISARLAPFLVKFGRISKLPFSRKLTAAQLRQLRHWYELADLFA